MIFLGWQYDLYDAFGDLVEEGYAAEGSVFAADGYIKAEPYYLTRSILDFENTTEIPSQVLSYIQNENGTASIADGKFVLTQDVANVGNNYWYVNPTTKVDDANAVVFEADFSAKITSGDAYMTIYTGANGGDKIYWAYLSISNGYLRIKNEYVCNPSQVGHNVEVKTPIKVDGTTYKLRVIYRETEWGENFLDFYADGKLFHTTNRLYASTYNTNQKGPDAADVGCFTINFGKGAAGTMTLDNVAMTQVTDVLESEFKTVGRDDSIIDFDLSATDITKSTAETENKFYSYGYDEKTGSSYLLLNKHETGSGLSIDIPVTYEEENANYAVLSFDYYIENSVTRMDNQIYAAHKTSSGFANATTPILATLDNGNINAHKGKWIHVELTYEAIGFADDGTVNKVECKITVTNGPAANLNSDPVTGVYYRSDSKFKLFNSVNNSSNTMEVPTAAELTRIRISLNNNAYGDVRFDNISFKLINKTSN
jgi:hypothetical protein